MQTHIFPQSCFNCQLFLCVWMCSKPHLPADFQAFQVQYFTMKKTNFEQELWRSSLRNCNKIRSNQCSFDSKIGPFKHPITTSTSFWNEVFESLVRMRFIYAQTKFQFLFWIKSIHPSWCKNVPPMFTVELLACSKHDQRRASLFWAWAHSCRWCKLKSSLDWFESQLLALSAFWAQHSLTFESSSVYTLTFKIHGFGSRLKAGKAFRKHPIQYASKVASQSATSSTSKCFASFQGLVSLIEQIPFVYATKWLPTWKMMKLTIYWLDNGNFCHNNFVCHRNFRIFFSYFF